MDLEDIKLSEFKSAEIEKYDFDHLHVKSTKWNKCMDMKKQKWSWSYRE